LDVVGVPTETAVIGVVDDDTVTLPLVARPGPPMLI
jgi:hypothetical protein